jgi:CRISPR-associated protein Cmr3
MMAAPENTTWFHLEPIDSWSFGDGGPNHAGEDQSDLGCLFPPSPLTVAGAIRAAAARALGWSGRPTEPWPAEIVERLGDGLDPGPLRFTGPFLARDAQPLFPAPAHLVGTVDANGEWQPADLLAPGAEAMTDLSERPVRLPEPRGAARGAEWSALKPPRGVWLTAQGLSRILAGEIPAPEDCVQERDLFAFEQRVGLELEADSRTAREAHLYSPVHVRLKRNVGLIVGAAGLDATIQLPELLPLGGEGRLAACRVVSEPPLPAAERKSPGAAWTCLVALTPVRLLNAARDAWDVPRPGDTAARLVAGLEGEIVSLCIERPLRLGGWDSVRHRPLPLIPHARAGTVWFVRGDPPRSTVAVRAGLLTAFGFGHLVAGSI